MGNIFLARGIAVDDVCSEGNVVGVFHAAFASTDITDTIEGVGAETGLKEADDLLDMDKSARHVVHLVGLGVHLNRNITFDTVIDIFPQLIFAHGKGNVVSSDFLRRIPMPSGSAIAIIESLNEITATDGFLIVGCGDIDVVGGLVSEVVDAGEPSLAKVVRLAIEAHAKAVDTIRIAISIRAPPFNTAPSFAESRTTIAHIKDGTFVGCHRLVESDS